MKTFEYLWSRVFLLVFLAAKSSIASSMLIVFASQAFSARTLRFEILCCVIVDHSTFFILFKVEKDHSAFATVAGIVEKMRRLCNI